LTTGSYSLGKIYVTWDGVTTGIHNYEWSISFPGAPPGTLPYTQTFQITWEDLSIHNCALAVFDPVAALTITEKFLDYSVVPIPYPTADIETLVGDPFYCGERSITSSKEWLIVDTVLNELQTLYFG
jgi:hypothetical protein